VAAGGLVGDGGGVAVGGALVGMTVGVISNVGSTTWGIVSPSGVT